MPEKRLPMRRIREVLRLHFEAKLNERQIAKICSVGKGTVRRYLKRTVAAVRATCNHDGSSQAHQTQHARRMEARKRMHRDGCYDHPIAEDLTVGA